MAAIDPGAAPSLSIHQDITPMRAFGYIASTLLVSSLVMPAVAHATSINYESFGNINTPTSFSSGGLTATVQSGLTSTLSLRSFGGLGVLGGGLPAPNVETIDGTESVLFSFDSGGATGISFRFRVAFVSGGNSMNLEAFGLNGLSLGLHSFDPNSATGSLIDVSALYGNATLSAFRLVGGGNVGAGLTGGSLRLVNFTDAPQVPEPATLLLCATGLALGASRKLRVMRGR